MGQDSWTDFYIPAHTLHTRSLCMLEKRNPALYKVVHGSEALTNAFTSYSILEVKKMLFHMRLPEVDDECSALRKFQSILQSSFETISTAFFRRLIKSHDKVTASKPLRKDESTSQCPICLEQRCDMLLSCCHAEIHGRCFVEYTVSGSSTCPCCRTEL